MTQELAWVPALHDRVIYAREQDASDTPIGRIVQIDVTRVCVRWPRGTRLWYPAQDLVRVEGIYPEALRIQEDALDALEPFAPATARKFAQHLLERRDGLTIECRFLDARREPQAALVERDHADAVQAKRALALLGAFWGIS